MGLRMTIASMAVAGAIAASPAQAEKGKCTSTATTEQVVRDFFDLAFVQGKFREGIERYIREDYIQHNPMAADGRAAVLAFFGSIPADKLPKVTLARIIAQCDTAAVHYKIEMAGIPAMAVVDIFRVQDGLIAEHWDVAQPMPEKSANSHPMF